MTLLAGILELLLVIAAVYIAVLHLINWLERRGGLTIRLVVEDDGDA